MLHNIAGDFQLGQAVARKAATTSQPSMFERTWHPQAQIAPSHKFIPGKSLADQPDAKTMATVG